MNNNILKIIIQIINKIIFKINKILCVYKINKIMDKINSISKRED